MAKVFNWGIIGLGNIAHKFAQDLQGMKSARLHAVASRSFQKAEIFANKYNTPNYFGSYEEIVKCSDLDVIYIATPHAFHCENTIMCLNAKIPVLCEKPFAMNAAEVRRMIAAAKNNNTFLMEALWTRFLPSIKRTLSIIEKGMIGEVLSIKADFGFKADFDSEGRLYNQKLGGGSLLDIGIYPVFLALLVLGRPFNVKALATIGQTNVDESCGIIFKYTDSKLAILNSTILTKTATEALIYGEKGTIRINGRWHEPTSITLMLNGKEPKDIFFDYSSNGYSYEAEEVMRCLRQKRLSSPLLNHHFSLDLIELLDEIRMEAGIYYPHDDKFSKALRPTDDTKFSLN
jgi:predicted dehydrogenase